MSKIAVPFGEQTGCSLCDTYSFLSSGVQLQKSASLRHKHFKEGTVQRYNSRTPSNVSKRIKMYQSVS